MNAHSNIQADDSQFSTLELTRIIADAERRKQMVTDLPTRTPYDRECRRDAISYLNEVIMQASGAIDYISGEEELWECNSNLHALFGDDPTFFYAAEREKSA